METTDRYKQARCNVCNRHFIVSTQEFINSSAPLCLLCKEHEFGSTTVNTVEDDYHGGYGEGEL